MTLGQITRESLLACCGSHVWADRMMTEAPFASSTALHDAAERIWNSLAPADWLEAFAAHPKIGEQSQNAWSRQEQSVASVAEEHTALRLRLQNVAYEQKFGWIFIICATGKSAVEILAALEQRMGNSRDVELRTAAAEQVKIMHLRLNKLLAQ